jgi:hypothetical protein
MPNTTKAKIHFPYTLEGDILITSICGLRLTEHDHTSRNRDDVTCVRCLKTLKRQEEAPK